MSDKGLVGVQRTLLRHNSSIIFYTDGGQIRVLNLANGYSDEFNSNKKK